MMLRKMTQGNIFNTMCIGGSDLPVQIFQSMMAKSASGFRTPSCSFRMAGEMMDAAL
ncbi:hypothetical protein ACC817_04880 [Rhizobium ruizarguesonis]|uniref:hypothetical protein n=1 Tax=Rhizobium ruizarguesonis TaxID=2081791 RepID=UPI0013EEBE31|nr:hypothetical protein [Rhizobium ruizarguesonis]WSH67598.1 hypothetical protein U8Q05_07690 [Rhizobium ruizarguesonis]